MSNFLDTKTYDPKGNIPVYEYRNGANKIKPFGDVIARYQYFIENQPFECLAFNRDTQSFDNNKGDPVRKLEVKGADGEDIKASFAYVSLALDLNDGEPKVVKIYWKSTVFKQLQAVAKKLKSDPFDLDNGFYVTFDKVKTGPKRYNVEYTIDQIACLEDKRAVTEEERALIEEAPSAHDVFPRESAEDQEARLNKVLAGSTTTDNSDDLVGPDGIDEDDIPF